MRGWFKALICWAAAMAGAGATAADPLVDGFRDPPQSARPRAFWHWMNGNVSAEGIRLDLEWMKRVGLGGAVNAEVDLGTPVIVGRRIGFATPEWAGMVHVAAETAHRLDLELGVFSSPGWTDMGAPFVAPADAMKKLVWSATTVTGGGLVSLQLPSPPDVAGPFQDVTGGQMTSNPWQAPPPFYRDAAVVAYRLADLDQPLPPATVTTVDGPIDGAMLSDGQLSRAVSLPIDPTHPQAWIRFDYPAPRTIRSATLAYPAPRGFGSPRAPEAKLEASADGRSFRPVCDIPITGGVEQTVSFPAVRARALRVVFGPAPSGPPERAPAAGLAPLPFGAPAKAYLVSELRFSAAARVNRGEDKAGFSIAPDYDAVATPDPGPGSAVARREVVDLTGRMGPDGRLDWRAPAGRWTVLRFGYGLTGRHNAPAAPDATGLEVDKLDPARVRAYLERWLALHGQTADARPLQALLNDSIESGPQNWTDDMLVQFRRRRGYDATPWLPALTGIIVGNAAASDRFLWDFRRTLAELFAESHYGVEAAVAHEHGLALYNEALEDHRPQLGDDLEMRRYADVPMGAMWTFSEGEAPQPTYVADDLGAASAAHLWGANLAGAESMTAFGHPWAYAPRDLKPVADEEFALGINRIVIHTSAHQPLTDKAPQMSLAPFLGQYFSRTETWAEDARPWVDYLARSSFLLQQGRFAADVAYFYGEEGPLTGLYGDGLPKDLPTGYGFDFVDAEAVRTLLSVKDGRLATPSRMSYRLLYLGGASRSMTVATLQRLLELARAGAVLVGEPPPASRSLADDPAAFAGAVHDLWPKGTDAAAGTAVGRGRVFSGRTPVQALQALGVAPDVDLPGVADDVRPPFVHRRLSDGDLYFISNPSAKAVDLDAIFRISGKAPQAWRADTGEIADLSYQIRDGRTRVPLHLDPHEAVFVVFRQPAAASSRRIGPPVERDLARIDGAWTLAFQTGRGAPSTPITSGLGSWTDSHLDGVKYFSGTATYQMDFTSPPTPAGGKLLLDLGEVRDIARVRLNGRDLGIAWRPPYRFDITAALRPGQNALEVKVTNLWVNRLIGDQQPGARKIAFTTGPTYTADAPLRPSGLLGPVLLVASTPTTAAPAKEPRP